LTKKAALLISNLYFHVRAQLLNTIMLQKGAQLSHFL